MHATIDQKRAKSRKSCSTSQNKPTFHQKSRVVLCALPTLLYFREHTLYNCICHTPKKASGQSYLHQLSGSSVRRCACGVGINLFTRAHLGGRSWVSVSSPSSFSSSSPALPFRSTSFGFSGALLRSPASCIRKMPPHPRFTLPTANSSASSLAKTERRFPTIPLHRPLFTPSFQLRTSASTAITVWTLSVLPVQ